MSLVIQDLRDGLRRSCGGIEIADYSNAIVDLWLNRAYWEVMDKFPYREKQKTSTFSFTENVRFYDAPTPFECVTKISIADPDDDDNKHTPLKRMTIDRYEQEYDSDEDQNGKPEWYIRYGTGYYVFTTPDKTYDGFIYYNTTLADIADDNTTPEIPQVWHEILQFGGTARGWLELGSTDKAMFYFNLQAAKINTISPVEAKEEEDSPLAGVELPEDLTRV